MSALEYGPESLYDCLTIIGQLEKPLCGVSRLEVQKLAFLACILSLYKNQPASDWGYRFARTPYGTPFSRQINSAFDFVLASGNAVLSESGRATRSPKGTALTNHMSGLEDCRRRDPFLSTATASLLVVPPGTMMRGLENEPTTSASETKPAGATLLEGPALRLLYDDFTSLTTVFNNPNDLLTPSVVWLTCAAGEPLSRSGVQEASSHA